MTGDPYTMVVLSNANMTLLLLSTLMKMYILKIGKWNFIRIEWKRKSSTSYARCFEPLSSDKYIVFFLLIFTSQQPLNWYKDFNSSFE